ncbi:3'-5' exonuclease [Microbacterium sp. NIBRBAC000506063]|uniref:3'-5' exonuclease n=1 Tax=Microbacterium sp. NIBRBAC000506063 TaxID=2734618 RepID=UPI001BB7C88A|nr:3'-5' exonuclease [Microbacterium sp. NIBRBAC000506063]QTV79811.1 hypothetical protein KAE78_00700 [Microbacterium sp. NIBRBAC000506063]
MLERLRHAITQPLPELIRLIELELRLDIELAANETRGPARVASTQLRAFADEVRAFLAADERGTIGSLLAWLEKAESSDELMPRAEPPEPGVVQLLTIHGSKGLEWDAVAVVRMVADELPSRPTDTSGWFGFGVLPFPLRGDRDALPTFEWIPPDDTETDPAKRQKAFVASLTSRSASARAHSRGSRTTTGTISSKRSDGWPMSRSRAPARIFCSQARTGPGRRSPVRRARSCSRRSTCSAPSRSPRSTAKRTPTRAPRRPCSGRRTRWARVAQSSPGRRRPCGARRPNPPPLPHRSCPACSPSAPPAGPASSPTRRRVCRPLVSRTTSPTTPARCAASSGPCPSARIVRHDWARSSTPGWSIAPASWDGRRAGCGAVGDR